MIVVMLRSCPACPACPDCPDCPASLYLMPGYVAKPDSEVIQDCSQTARQLGRQGNQLVPWCSGVLAITEFTTTRPTPAPHHLKMTAWSALVWTVVVVVISKEVS